MSMPDVDPRKPAGRLQGRLALVTGAGSGFGAGISERFVAEGASVLVADIDAGRAADTCARLGKAAAPLIMDVSDDASVQRALAGLERTPEILVNNAGIAQPPTPLEAVSPGEFEQLLAVNVRGIYLTARHLVPAMKKTGGVILNIASTAGISPRPGLTWYNASKGWVITATRSMAVELAPFDIRVNALNPVAGETPLLATFMGGDSAENRERFLGSIPLGRFSTPRDIGAAAAFLCSGEADFLTGVTLEVDGGRCV